MARHMTGQIVTFPILNRMFGVDSLAKRLNALVSAGQIAGWHPERWIDWDHTAIQISFDFVEDATFASKLCLEIAEKLPAAGAPAATVRRA